MTDARAMEILREIVALRTHARAAEHRAKRYGFDRDQRQARAGALAVCKAIDAAAKELGE